MLEVLKLSCPCETADIFCSEILYHGGSGMVLTALAVTGYLIHLNEI